MLTILVLAIPLVAEGELPGVYLALLALVVLGSFEAVQPLGTAFQFLGRSVEAGKRLFKVVDARPEISAPQTLSLRPKSIQRSPEVEDSLREAAARHGSRWLPAADTHRVWGSRFYSSGVTGGTPYSSSVLLPLEGLGHVLSRAGTHLSTAMQGSVSRTGEVLLLAFGQEEAASWSLGTPGSKHCSTWHVSREAVGTEKDEGTRNRRSR